jgi:glucose-1-phosphate cytidylyltransferase
MKLYAHHGFAEFVVALGYRGDAIKRYFLDFPYVNADLTVRLQANEVTVHQRHDEAWTVHLVDTGLDTITGGRIKRLRGWIGAESFMLTYGDGVADVDVKALIAFHRKSKVKATLTAVQPPGRFGALMLQEHLITSFQEKPMGDGGWINGGFFVLSPGVLDYIDGDSTVWEREPLERLAQERSLAAYFHRGFWQPMDTLRDRNQLEEVWASGRAPWKIWR